MTATAATTLAVTPTKAVAAVIADAVAAGYRYSVVSPTTFRLAKGREDRTPDAGVWVFLTETGAYHGGVRIDIDPSYANNLPTLKLVRTVLRIKVA